jgi:hypothetical protein
MANVLLTNDIILRESLSILRQKLTFLRRINRRYDDRFAVTGAKAGDTISIRVPTHGKVRNGRAMDAGDMVDRVVPLTIANQQGVDLVINSSDLTLSIDDLRERYLDQRISDLAAAIEGQVIADSLKSAYQTVDNPDGVLSFEEALKANKLLSDQNAPAERFMLTNTTGTIQVVNNVKNQFNSQNQIGRQYEEGLMFRSAGFDWYETSTMPTQTMSAATGYLVNGANQTGNSLIVDTGTGAFKAGDRFTIANVYTVNPATKQSTGTLQTFVVTADKAAGAGTLAIAPALLGPGNDNQTVTALPADNAALTFQAAANGTGVNLAFARDFVTFATVDLQMPPAGIVKASRMEFDGLSMRMIQDFDTRNDQMLYRLDILWGSAVLRPELGVVIPNDLTKIS